jgi:hypothetical protein
MQKVTTHVLRAIRKTNCYAETPKNHDAERGDPQISSAILEMAVAIRISMKYGRSGIDDGEQEPRSGRGKKCLPMIPDRLTGSCQQDHPESA